MKLPILMMLDLMTAASPAFGRGACGAGAAVQDNEADDAPIQHHAKKVTVIIRHGSTIDLPQGFSPIDKVSTISGRLGSLHYQKPVRSFISSGAPFTSMT